MKALSNKDCMFISQMEIIYIEVLADLISNTKMVATNGDYPPKSPLRRPSGQALSLGDFKNRSRVGNAHQYTKILFWERFSLSSRAKLFVYNFDSLPSEGNSRISN